MSRSKLIRPSPIVTGSISTQHLADARVAEVERDPQLEADAPQHRHAHAELDDGPGEHAERVGVELVRALNSGLQDDQRSDDHEVPHHRRDRRDREVVVGVEDPDHEPVEPEQHDDREHHAATARPSGRRARRVNLSPVNGGITHRRDQDEDAA